MVSPVDEAIITGSFSIFGACLISVPLYWHLEAWNVGCVIYIFWVGLLCLFNGVNYIVWRNSAIDFAPGWCDFYIRFYIGASIGVVCASLVINRRLYHIANVSAVSITRADKRRNMITDLLIGLGIPLLSIAVYWFYQGHRFNILEGMGCLEAYPNTWLALILYFLWPIPLGLVSGTYCILTLRAFFKRRRQFNELMASNKNLTFNRYFRLMGLASIEVMFTIPLTIYNIVSNFKQDPYPWRGFADLHSGFGRVDHVAAISWRSDSATVSLMRFRAWVPVALACTFFLFFGLAEEARKHYKMALSSVAKRVGITTFDRTASTGFSSAGSKSGFGKVTIPTFIQPNASMRRGSMDSFSDRLSTNISISEVEEKAAYSPGGSSVGSSTYISSPTDSEKAEKNAQPSPIALSVPTINFPKPPRAYRPASPTPSHDDRGDADVPSSVRPNSGIDMV
ncbi:STE3-domain-containing protein [Dichomitus squalens]|uniref:STE3-domain-containing protein n=1 Tax=Dichomitus squalens (strain LYAD-421) TaxID=732165 RepID=R7STP5_DICSQ|nr:STE3-domain-containing protein [Dichomitus squalens LYAD-421 SS1]EJF59110.1 STE3-domain-containing protein [Dichomitus squalens LYAD-421 SS1]TBU43028.1 STE3-domain-containing protein [Dichomitus squalens]